MSDFKEFTVDYTLYDNVATPVFSRNFPPTSFARVYIQATAVRPSNGDNRSFYRTLSILRGGGGPSLSSVVEIHSPIGTGGAAAWDLTFAVNGNDVQVLITGQTAATTVWQIKIMVFFLREE